MRYMNGLKIAAVCSAMLLASGGVWAASGKQDFSSLDLSSATFEQIQKSYEEAEKQYQEDYQDLISKRNKAWSQNNARRFYEIQDQIDALEDPSLTREQSETLVERMMNSVDDEKAEWGKWLYENDPYYQPKLTMRLESKGSRRNYSFEQTISVEPGQEVSLPTLDASGSKGVFVGWGITPDKVTYQAGDKISMPYADQSLYAIFQKGVKFSDPVTGYEQFFTDSEAQVPELTAPDASYIFDGWYDRDGDELTEKSVSVTDDSAETYTAYWKSIAFSDIKTRYYKDMTIPGGEQVPLTFEIKNQGSEALRDVKVSLEAGDELNNLTGDLSSRYIAPGSTKRGTFVLVADGKSGDKIDATIKVTDEDGDGWSMPVTITLK